MNPAQQATELETENALVARARGGDCRAFDELCRMHGDRLFRHALGLCKSESSAQDLVQETLIKGWRGMERFESRCRFFTWLCSILIHTHKNSLRRWWPIPFALLPADESASAAQNWADVSENGPNPAEQLLEAETALELLQIVGRLPGGQREVVYLRFYASASIAEMAATLRCSEGTIKSRLFNGLEKLKQLHRAARKHP